MVVRQGDRRGVGPNRLLEDLGCAHLGAVDAALVDRHEPLQPVLGIQHRHQQLLVIECRQPWLEQHGEVFRVAYLLAFFGCKLGDPTPSADDIALTADLERAARILDIELIDHLVIGDGRWLSLRRLGLGFSPAGTSS